MDKELFQCNTCNKCFNSRYHLERHQNKKKPCSTISKKHSHQYVCDKCNSIFVHNSSLKRHVEHERCKLSVESTIEKLFEKHLGQSPSTIIQNNQTIQQTFQNIIQFVLPGQESIGHITDTQFLEALDMDDFQDVLCELMRMTYFHPDAPENNHWCVAFLNGKFGVLQYNPKTERIERTSTEKSIVLHFDNLFYSLGEKMDYFMNELTLTDNQVRNINIFYKYLGTADPNTEEFNEIKMMAYNNRSIPIELWKSMGIKGEHKKIKL
jgi:hypothetical protein